MDIDAGAVGGGFAIGARDGVPADEAQIAETVAAVRQLADNAVESQLAVGEAVDRGDAGGELVGAAVERGFDVAVLGHAGE